MLETKELNFFFKESYRLKNVEGFFSSGMPLTYTSPKLSTCFVMLNNVQQFDEFVKTFPLDDFIALPFV